MTIKSIREASRLQCALLPPGDAPITENGGPDVWRENGDPLTLVARQKWLNHVQDDLRADRLNSGDARVAALRAFVRGVEVEIAFQTSEVK